MHIAAYSNKIKKTVVTLLHCSAVFKTKRYDPKSVFYSLIVTIVNNGRSFSKTKISLSPFKTGGTLIGENILYWGNNTYEPR